MTEGLALKAAGFVKRGLRGYDACYAALAEDVSGKWLTYDAKAHRRISAAGVSHCISDGLPREFGPS